MSRIGKQPITIPQGVTVTQEDGMISATGPKGSLAVSLLPELKVSISDDQLTVTKTAENPTTQQSYGLMRTLVANIITGVSEGYQKQLEINGVGYRAAVSGSKVTLNLGFSHPVEVNLPQGIAASIDKNVMTITGSDKQLVGQVAANIRALRKPEPYKGKGIKYIDETIRRKAGKTATKG